MSKLGRKPIEFPQGVSVARDGDLLAIKGKLGEIKVPVLKHVDLTLEEKSLTISAKESGKQARANWGTMAAMIKNALKGVQEGFEKKLEIQGVGFRASMEGENLNLSVGFSHPVKYSPREGTELSVEKNIITVKGIEPQVVGQVAAEIRAIKKPEPYQGKGIRYVGENVRRKQGKKVAGTGAAAA